MITFRPLASSSASEYFKSDLEQTVATSYYLTTGAEPPRWEGKLAEHFGLTGIAPTQKQLQRVLDGYHPITGEDLVQRRLKGNKRRQGIDITASAPKSVSVMAMFDARIPDLVRQADKLAMLELETFSAARVRSGGANHSEQTGKMIWMTVEHGESRSLFDPQLHAHHVAANLTLTADGSMRALDASEALRRCRLFTEIFRNRLAQSLRAAGYELEQHKDGFELAAVPPAVNAIFSKSRARIEEAERDLENKLGRKISNDERGALAKLVKRAKVKGVSPEEIRQFQLSQLSAEVKAELTAAVERAKANSTGNDDAPPPNGESAAAAAALFAKRHVFERKTIESTWKLAEHALRHSQGRATWEQIKKGIGKLGLVRDGTDCTTEEAIELERRIMAFAETGRGQFEPFARNADLTGLAPEQQHLVATVLGSHDRVVLTEAPPGSGKSFALRSISKAIPNAVCVAPTAAAVEVLAADGIPAKTLDSFLNDRRSHASVKTVIIDEASLVSAVQCDRLFSYAKLFGWRILAQGDRKQNASVARGNPFQLLLEHTNSTRGALTEIRRQRPKAYRAAIKAMSTGRMDQGLAKLEQMQCVQEFDDAEQRRQATASYYCDALARGTVCAVAPTWHEISESTAAIRKELRGRGRLSTEEVEFETLQNIDLSLAQRKHRRYWPKDSEAYFNRRVGSIPLGTIGKFYGKARDNLGFLVDASGLHLIKESDLASLQAVRRIKIRLSVGDKLLLQANGKTDDGRRLTNGTTAEIAKLDHGQITLTDGRVLPRNYQRYTLGYVTTSFAAQGATANTALGIFPSGAGVTKKAVFVAASRGRDQVLLVTDDISTFRGQLIAEQTKHEHAFQIKEAGRTNRVRSAVKLPDIGDSRSGGLPERGGAGNSPSQESNLDQADRFSR